MAKKKAKKLTKKEMLAKYHELSGELRKVKIDKDKIDKQFKSLKEDMMEMAYELNLEKGDYNGIKLVHMYKFLPSNVEIAEEHEIEIPENISLDLTPRRINQLIKDGVFVEDEIVKTPNLKQLEKVMKEEKLLDECEYELSYSFRYATE